MSVAGKPNALLAPHEWPGCAVGYVISREGAAGAALRIAISYDPAAVPAGAEVGLTAWLAIRRHANDPSLEVAVSCSLVGTSAVGDPAEAVRQYRAAVEQLFRHVARGVAGPVAAAMTLPLDPTLISQGDILFPLAAALTVSRLVSRPAAGKQAQRERAHSPLAPWLRPAPTGVSTIAAWAQAAEEALTGHDGAGGRIRLARAASSRLGSLPELWAVRWGGRGGVTLVRGEEPAIAFAARPFAGELLAGSVDITTWSEALVPETRSHTFSGIDADAVFDRVLTMLDELLAPGSAAALGRAGPDALAHIDRARHAAVQALAARVVPVLAAHEGLGEPARAGHRMEQAILSGIADPASIVVQVAIAEGLLPVRLRLSGDLSDAASDLDQRAELLLEPQARTWLSFSAFLPTSGGRTALPLQPAWTATDVERLQDAGEVVPPGRLTLLLPPEAPDLALGALQVPLPARFHPAPVTPAGQAASSRIWDATGQTLAMFMQAAMRWSLTFSIDRRGMQSADDAWLALSFNRAPARHAANAEEFKPLTPPVIALLRFQEGCSSLASRLTGTDDAPLAASAADILAKLASELAQAFTAPSAGMAAAPRVDLGETLTWVWRNAPNPDGSHSLFARCDPDDFEQVCFPTVAGCPAQDRGPVSADRAPDTGVWREATYHLPADGEHATLDFVLDGLDLSSRQTAAVSACVMRNPVAAGFNPQLARSTGWISPGPAVTPAIDLTEPFATPPDDVPLDQALTIILSALGRVGDRIACERELGLRITYRYPLGRDDDASELMASVPVLSTSIVPTGGEVPARIAAALVAECRAWGETNPLPRTDACLSMSAALGGAVDGVSAPLLTIRRIDLPLPPDWREDGRSPSES